MKTLRKKVKGETPISHLLKIKTFIVEVDLKLICLKESWVLVVVVLACWGRQTQRKENVKKSSGERT